jgi:antitoxin component of MazEF toxin-antitoxin module
MSKPRKVIAVGNSFALTIDKKTCRLLRIDRTTELRVTIEDKDTILVRPIRRADRTGQPDRFQLERTLRVLIERYGMGPAEFKPLSHDGTSWRTFLLDAQVGGHVDLITVARIAHCLQLRSDAARRREEVPWEATIARVLELVPEPPRAAEPPDPTNDGTLLDAGRTPP